MRKMVVFLLSFLLWGCAKSEVPQGPMCRVVNRVDVTATIDGQTYGETHTASKEMESVMCYLRLLQKGKKADIDPDSFRSDYYEITVSYSDGQHTVYRQLHRDFLQIDDGPWRTIDGAKIELLFPESSSIMW